MKKLFYFASGTKQEYKNVITHSPETLYWCWDTRELFKGDDLYTDGIRSVDTYESLPEPEQAAEGKLYHCRDTGCGYILNQDGDGYDLVLHGIDGDTLEYKQDGLLAVKQVPLESVTGLDERLSEIQTAALGGAIATSTVAGLVKPSAEFSVAADGTLTLAAVEQRKITGLEDRLEQIEDRLTWQSMDV